MGKKSAAEKAIEHVKRATEKAVAEIVSTVPPPARVVTAEAPTAAPAPTAEPKSEPPPPANGDGTFDAHAVSLAGLVPGMSAHEYGRTRPAMPFPTPWRRESGTMILNIPSGSFATLGMPKGSPGYQLYRRETTVYVDLLNGRDPLSKKVDPNAPARDRKPFGTRKHDALVGIHADISKLSERLKEAHDHGRVSALIADLDAAAHAVGIAAEGFKAFPHDFVWEVKIEEPRVERDFKVNDRAEVRPKFRQELSELTGCDLEELSLPVTIVKVVPAMKSAVVMTADGTKVPVALKYLQ